MYSAAKKIVEHSEEHLRWVWDQSSTDEKLVLATLTALLDKQDRVTSSDIASKLAEQHKHMDPAEVSLLLGKLAARDIVEEISEPTMQYKFKVEIYNLWIQKHKPLNLVIEDVMVRVPEL